MQTEQPEVTLILYREGISIRAIGRPFPNAKTAWDRDALDIILTVSAGPFSGTFPMMTFSNELSVLRDRLKNFCQNFSKMSGFRFETLESNIALNVSVIPGTEIHMQLTIQPEATEATKLSFALEPELSQLEDWLTQLDQLLTMYPRTPPNQGSIVLSA